MTSMNNDTIGQDAINAAVWSACDTFRGTVDPSTYKDYVLTMLFLKYISDVWQDHYARYQAKHGNHPELIEELLRTERFVLPASARFDTLHAARHQPGNGERIDKALHTIEDANLAKMIEVCDRLVSTITQEEGRRLFWVAGSLIFGVRSGEIEATTERGGGVADQPPVQADHAVIQLFADLSRAFEITRKDIGDQPIFCVIGAGDHLGLIRKGLDCGDGAENLFTDNGHIVGAAGEDGWFNKGALRQIAGRHTLPAGQQICALLLAKRDIAQHLFHM